MLATTQSTVSYKLVHDSLEELLKNPDHEAMDIAMATVKANELDGDAVAVFFVGPPASGKTELIMACHEVPSTYWLSEVSANTFGSGFSTKAAGGVQTSLLLKLDSLNKNTLLLKEFGTILSKRSSDKSEIIGQLRDILDGQYRKEHGSGREVKWEGRLGMLAGVTGEIEKQWGTVRRLGDRWLMVRPDVPTDLDSRLEIGLAALQGSGSGDYNRSILAADVAAHLEEVGTPSDGVIRFPEGLQIEVVQLANRLAILRTPISRDSYSKEVNETPQPEQPGRLSKALGKLARSLAIVRFRSEVTTDDLITIKRITNDSVPSKRQRVIDALWDGVGEVSHLVERLGVSKSQIKRELEELKLLGAATRNDDLWEPLL